MCLFFVFLCAQPFTKPSYTLLLPYYPSCCSSSTIIYKSMPSQPFLSPLRLLETPLTSSQSLLASQSAAMSFLFIVFLLADPSIPDSHPFPVPLVLCVFVGVADFPHFPQHDAFTRHLKVMTSRQRIRYLVRETQVTRPSRCRIPMAATVPCFKGM